LPFALALGETVMRDSNAVVLDRVREMIVLLTRPEPPPDEHSAELGISKAGMLLLVNVLKEVSIEQGQAVLTAPGAGTRLVFADDCAQRLPSLVEEARKKTAGASCYIQAGTCREDGSSESFAFRVVTVVDDGQNRTVTLGGPLYFATEQPSPTRKWWEFWK
jgi:hypothetical protein